MSGAHTRRAGVIGSGVAGLTSAYVISGSAEVTLFEADDRLGGHADTHLVPTAAGPVAIDTGFIVHNERTYPTLLRLFRELGVRTQPSDMSMSVRSDEAGLEYAGARGPLGLFPTWRNLARPAYLRMLTEVPRFHRRARRLLASPDDGSAERDVTLAEFLEEGRFSTYFRRHFMTPLVAAVWSCDPDVALEYPARYLFEFLRHHGMLAVFGSPQWRTVTGGSREYVDRLAAELVRRGGTIALDTKVTSVLETPHGVEVTDGSGTVHLFDAVVVATHPEQALGMLAEPTAAQREVLAAMPYSRNVAQLHTDTSLLPRHPRARASWNHLERSGTGAVTVTYDLTRLMSLPTESEKELTDARMKETLKVTVPVASGSGPAAGASSFTLLRQNGHASADLLLDFSSEPVLMFEGSLTWRDVHGVHQRSLRTMICRAGLTRSGVFGSSLGRAGGNPPPLPAP